MKICGYIPCLQVKIFNVKQGWGLAGFSVEKGTCSFLAETAKNQQVPNELTDRKSCLSPCMPGKIKNLAKFVYCG